MKIGILDWGIGGLSVYKELRKQNPMIDVVYHSDSGFTPYGKLSPSQMRERFIYLSQFFSSQNISEVLVACNAASSILSLAYPNKFELIEKIKFYSIIPYGVQTVKNLPASSTIIIGGKLTIESKLYQKELSEKNFEYTSAQTLSALVEDGKLTGLDVENAVKNVLESLTKFSNLLLACTHYPALIPTITKIYPHLKCLDPAFLMAEEFSVKKYHDGSSSFMFHTTGNLEKSRNSALKAFDIKI